ncbi:oligopeptide ABC transporter permease OppC [Lactiplantibacillus plantarum]|uniref:oligopeptide ABC transporter permease OppC n=1 Tax=Lactiplantibacillus plantarum TaxID=1590 RepID=UPI0007AB514E|nr:oligopeptide ABC transporter permease OppC [Lactiplantibacillus plantarum]ASX22759.1 peptide ABC transporter permease [Lactiplantibacillus plantarum]KZD97500.1 Oligopeptide transport system permease protein OppC [Lactiplantibacillus plantarum]KZT99669.1 Oligopeptide transport system permease proteinOppC [Lactiplantibacillus plantarum]KZU20884.1 Oligopeptide transport system permease proteinOppC [Lactiplantibacillus plantarum]KZU22905.1 Oligopeptide transport system permease proteinOppC [Lac
MVIGRDKPQSEKVDQNQISDADFEFVTLNDQATEKIETPRYSYWRSVAKAFFANKLTIAMFVLMLIILLLAFIQPLFSGYSLMNVSNINDFGARYNWPSWHYWFGTDADGKSLFDAVWAGARTSISIGVIASLITTVIGVAVGAFWGNSKKLDRVMLEIYNVLSNVPNLLIIIVLSYTFGNGFWNLIFAMTVTTWLDTAYFIRVQVILRRDREYNIASKTLGTPMGRLIIRNVLPYLTSVIVTQLSQLLPSFISFEVFLSFLGVGLSANVPSLGRLIAQYSPDMTSYPYLFWLPVTVLALITVSLYIVGQNLADASDPRTHR